MPADIPVALTWGFYGLIAWGLSAVFVAFRLTVGEDLKRGIFLRVLVLVWMGIPAVLAIRGVYLDVSDTPPQLMRTVLAMGLFILVFAFSSWGRTAAERLPVSLLVGIHVFRLPLEIVLHELGSRGLIPVEMTFRGFNYDIISGVMALFLWYMVRRQAAPQWALWAFNILGTLLLITVVALAVLAFPEPFGWFTPPTLIVAFYPWTWLPTFLVPIALTSHLLLFRKLVLPTPPPSLNV